MLDNGLESDSKIRFSSLECENFGCIKNASFSMSGSGKPDKSDIMGIFGQNGSGKSTIVRIFAFLRLLLCGSGIEDAGQYVKVSEDSASIHADFEIYGADTPKKISYYIRIKKTIDKWSISEEKIILIGSDGSNEKKSFVYNPSDAINIISPRNVKNELSAFIDKNSNLYEGVTSQIFFLVQKENCYFYNTSYIFNQKFLDLYESYCASSEESIFDYILLMNDYARNYLFVVTDNFLNEQFVAQKALPVILPNQRVSKHGEMSYFSLKFEGPILAREASDGDFLAFISRLNMLLSAMCPNVKLGAKKSSSPSYDNRTYYDVFTIRNGCEIPLVYESLGIKKIISMMNIMLMAYGNSSVLFVIDEFDCSIHELVIETFFKVFTQKKGGGGQIVFTSNNLHLLELLDKNQCCFAIASEKNAITHLKYVKPNNNLRSLYMSLIKNGGDDKNPDLFDPISPEKMQNVFDECFREA